jgi:tRNA G18 (ribose-2'-O)-methylase SpoU
MNAPPKVFLILDNLRSAYNVGSILRIAESAGVAKVYLTGITPTPLNPKVQKTSLSAHQTVAWEHHCSIMPLVALLKQQKISCYACENTPGALNLYQIKLPAQIAFIVGNENTGVTPAVIHTADGLIKIPQFGFKESLNVATAAGIIVYEHVRRQRYP